MQHDGDLSESVAAVAGLLRRAAELAWAEVDAAGPGSRRQVLALGIDCAADAAALLVSKNVGLADPITVGGDVSQLLWSAGQLLTMVADEKAPAVQLLRGEVAELVREVDAGAGA